VRQGDWKLIYHHVTRRLELFNLQKDLSEQEDLAHRESDKTKILAKVLADFLRDTKAGMTTDVATNKPVEYPDQVPHQGPSRIGLRGGNVGQARRTLSVTG
jgi:hypothetical protein